MKTGESKKTAYMIKTADSTYFEEAIFLLKKELPPEEEPKILTEANRIVAMQNAAMLFPSKKAKQKNHSPFYFFFSGIITASALFLFFSVLKILFY